jgi:hypothetical protein
MHMYTVARLLRCRQFSGYFLNSRVLQCTCISNMDRCKKDLNLIEVLPTNKGRWDSVFRTANRYGTDGPGTESRWEGGWGARYSVLVQTVPDNHPTCKMVIGSFWGWGGMTLGVGADKPTAFSAEVANMLEQYIRPVCLQSYE